MDDFLDDDSEGQSGVLTVDVLDEFRYRFSVGVRFERVTLLRLRKQQQLNLHYRKSSTLKTRMSPSKQDTALLVLFRTCLTLWTILI